MALNDLNRPRHAAFGADCLTKLGGTGAQVGINYRCSDRSG
jgi:hypothetical protein